MLENPAPVSYAHTAPVTCPACGASHTADIWLIVAPDERPDLLEQIRNGSLHTVTCPQCGQTHTPDAPLLIFRPTAEPPILFAPAQQTSTEQDQQHAAELIGILRQRLGAAWNDAWLAQGPAVVPRPMLLVALTDDPAAALQGLAARMQQALRLWIIRVTVKSCSALQALAARMQQALRLWIIRVTVKSCSALQALAARMQQTLDELRRRDPEAFARLEAAAQQAMAALQAADRSPDEAPESAATTDAPALVQAVDAFLNARTWIDSYRQVQAHPELLSDEALAMLDQAIAAARAANNADAVAFFEAHRALLRRCREVGAAAAFAEKIGVRVEELERREARGAVPAVFASWLATAQQAERRFLQTGDRNALTTAVEAWRQILEHPAFQTAPLEFRCAVLNDAGGTFLRCYWTQGRAADLERALTFCTEALAASPPDSPDRPSILNNLGVGLCARYDRSGRLEELDAAIAAYKQALDTTPPDSPNRPSILNNLGRGLHARYDRSGRLEDLDAAIAAYEQALDTTPPDSPDRPMYLNNLGTGLSARYDRSGRLEDLDAAIAAYEQALDATPPDSPDRPMYLNNLGTGLRDCYARSGRREELDAAIAAYEQALDARRAGEAHNRFSTRGMPSGAELSAVWQEIRTREASIYGESITTGNISGTGIAIGQGAQATVHQHFYEPRFTRYTDISCPRLAQVNSRVTVTVALTMQPQPESVALQAIEVFGGKVRVRIDAPGFEPLSPLEQTIIVERDDDSAPVVFHLKARETGPHEIAIQFWQRGNLIATVVAPIEVLEVEPVFAPALIPKTPVSPRMADVTPPDLTLVVFRDPAGRMQFTLHRDNVTLCYAEQTLRHPPDALLNALFDELHLLQRGTDSANRRRGSSLLTAEQVERRIRNLGYKLWDDLIPPELKLYYAREPHQWQSAIAAGQRWSLLVQSNEPDIPWELVRPYSDGPDCWEEDFWCQTFHFARWLLKRPDSPESVVPLPRLRLRTLAAIVPTCYPELKAVPEEHKLLRDLIARYRLTDRSPQRATEEEVIALLETGGFDWLHVITHGDFFAQSALHSSAITGPRIRGALRNHRPAIILNACHVGREQPSLSGAAGWVTQFVGSGAGMLVAPLWSVNDALALRFSEVFYAALLHPDRPATVAEAMWQARNAIRQPDDPTWLAYSLFAHPNARVEVQPLQA